MLRTLSAFNLVVVQIRPVFYVNFDVNRPTNISNMEAIQKYNSAYYRAKNCLYFSMP